MFIFQQKIVGKGTPFKFIDTCVGKPRSSQVELPKRLKILYKTNGYIVKITRNIIV